MSQRIPIFQDADENGEIEVYQDLMGSRIHFEVSEVIGVDHLIKDGYEEEYHRTASWSMGKDEFVGFVEEALEYFSKR